MATKVTTKQAARILTLVGGMDAAPPKIKTAFLKVVGQDVKSAGLSVDDVRAAMQAAVDMGIEGGDEPTTDTPDIAPAGAASKSAAKAPAKAAAKTAPAATKTPAKAAAKSTPAPRKSAAEKRGPLQEPTEAELATMLKDLKKADSERWGRVERIVSLTVNGKPERVVIKCENPDAPGTYTKERREIKVQDMFQVRYSVEDTKRVRSANRTLARAARKPVAVAKKVVEVANKATKAVAKKAVKK